MEPLAQAATELSPVGLSPTGWPCPTPPSVMKGLRGCTVHNPEHMGLVCLQPGWEPLSNRQPGGRGVWAACWATAAGGSLVGLWMRPKRHLGPYTVLRLQGIPALGFCWLPC